ncbi:MAG: hypothetical protein ACR2FO_02960 [Actinomycetota bacterium]
MVVDVEAEKVIRNYGLTEVFSESSEPPFEEFPFDKFKRLFPEGKYTFRGKTIEGQNLKSTFNFTHKVPDGPKILAPLDGATVARDSLVVEWAPVTSPSGINIAAYEVLVVADTPGLGNPKRVLDATVNGSVNRLPIPSEFLDPGTYKAEVLAIEVGGNQTLTEAAFTVE